MYIFTKREFFKNFLPFKRKYANCGQLLENMTKYIKNLVLNPETQTSNAQRDIRC